MFDLLFSPVGSVDRGTWWAVKILKWLAFVLVFFSIAPLFEGQPHRSFTYSPSLSSQVNASFLDALHREATARPGAFLPMLLAVAVVLWVDFVTEIKRWHDRGMSGFWYLLHFAGTAATAVSLPLLVLLIGLFQLIHLGFLGSYDDSSKPGLVSRAWNVLLPLVVALGILAAVVGTAILQPSSGFRAVYLTPPHLAPGFAFLNPSRPPTPASAAKTPAPSVAQAPVPLAPPLPESAFHGTSGTNYGPDWVVINGATIQGITAVTAVPGAQVALLDHDGGMDVPVASLPQGFLDTWKITPDELKAKNQP